MEKTCEKIFFDLKKIEIFDGNSIKHTGKFNFHKKMCFLKNENKNEKFMKKKIKNKMKK